MRALCAAMLTIAWAAVAFTPTAAATAEPYVFQGTPDSEFNGWGIWYSDGTAPPRPILDPGPSPRPALSPDAQTIAYKANGCIKTIGVAEGSVPVTIYCATSGGFGSGPSWHPGGQHLIFVLGGTDSRVMASDLAGNAVTLVNWPNNSEFRRPGYSPDGTKIAFSSWLTPEGNTEDNGSSIYVASADGTGVIDVSGADGGLDPRWSPNGDKVAFISYPETSTGGEVLLASADGTARSILTSDEIDQAGVEWSVSAGALYTDAPPGPDDGDAGWVSHLVSGTTGSSARVLDDWHWVEGIGFRQQSGNAPPPEDPYAVLLAKYAPELRYDSQETFFADSAATVTDHPENSLHQENSNKIAGHAPGDAFLSLDFLGSYSPHHSSDYLDETQDGEEGYSAASNGIRTTNPVLYANKTYGRAVSSGGRLWLQYWLFYYYNPWSPGLDTPAGTIESGQGTHEGDWELVQIGLNATTRTPEMVTYSRHGNAGSCPWTTVQKAVYGTDIVPIAYVGRGSHANYFSAGTHGGSVVLARDHADGGVAPLRPGVINVTTPPLWLSWPGHWGSTKGRDVAGVPTGSLGRTAVLTLPSESPPGPMDQGTSWDEPAAFTGGADECGSTATALGARGPEPPAVTATREGRSVVVDFAFVDGIKSSSIEYLVLTVHGFGERKPAIGETVKLLTAEGQNRIRLPEGEGPFVVKASAFSADGSRSRVVSTRVTGT